MTTLTFTLTSQTEESKKYYAYWKLILNKRKAALAAKKKEQELKDFQKKTKTPNKKSVVPTSS